MGTRIQWTIGIAAMLAVLPLAYEPGTFSWGRALISFVFYAPVIGALIQVGGWALGKIKRTAPAASSKTQAPSLLPASLERKGDTWMNIVKVAAITVMVLLLSATVAAGIFVYLQARQEVNDLRAANERQATEHTRQVAEYTQRVVESQQRAKDLISELNKSTQFILGFRATCNAALDVGDVLLVATFDAVGALVTSIEAGTTRTTDARDARYINLVVEKAKEFRTAATNCKTYKL